jgi:hypothetical protein
LPRQIIAAILCFQSISQTDAVQNKMQILGQILMQFNTIGKPHEYFDQTGKGPA